MNTSPVERTPLPGRYAYLASGVASASWISLSSASLMKTIISPRAPDPDVGACAAAGSASSTSRVGTTMKRLDRRDMNPPGRGRAESGQQGTTRRLATPARSLSHLSAALHHRGAEPPVAAKVRRRPVIPTPGGTMPLPSHRIRPLALIAFLALWAAPAAA